MANHAQTTWIHYGTSLTNNATLWLNTAIEHKLYILVKRSNTGTIVSHAKKNSPKELQFRIRMQCRSIHWGKATEAARSRLACFFHSPCLEKFKDIPVNSKNDEHKENNNYNTKLPGEAILNN